MHDLPVHEALLLVESDHGHGLSEQEAHARLRRFGPNVLPAVARRGVLARLALQFHHPLIYVLLAAAAVTFAIGEPVDGSVILGVVLVNAAIGFVQESRAERALDALASMVEVQVTVVRDGRRAQIAARDLVPGDVLLLAAGDAVAADTRLIGVNELRIDESALTGESMPVSKHERVLPSDTVVADRANMAFSGTLVTGGEGRGVVVATGAETELGLIHRLMGDAAEIATPLTRRIAEFSKVLTAAILALAALAFLLGIARGEEAPDMLVAAVALAVGAIPEGLPAALTITLAIGVRRMAGRNAIVRHLPAVETLGSTTVICSDKTGTLTENQMTVQAVVAAGRRYAVGGAGYDPRGEIAPAAGASADAALRACLRAGALCNDARLVRRDEGWEVIGDPTEGALLVAARKGGIDVEADSAQMPRAGALPFDSERRFMATVQDLPAGGRITFAKGAVERVLAMCDDALDAQGRRVPLDREAVEEQARELAAGALRVLAFAQRAAGGDGAPDPATEGLTFLGLQGMIDPPRAEAVAAIAACRRAGITVKMITGDHAATATAIARQIGLGGGGDGEPVATTGAALDELDDAHALEQVAHSSSVFARVSPAHKLRLVEALQNRGHIAAMTGDGVNDAPALKQADIGVAMGKAGTDVAREAGDIVLVDDNFASIEAAVEEGRRTFDNITKFIVWTLPTNIGEGLLILVAIAAGATLPILPVQILWINMTTAVALGLMLAFERQEPGIMSRPPRDPAQPLLTGQLMERIVLVSALLLAASFGLFEWEQARGASDAEARTVAVNVFVVVELFYLFNCRSLERSMLHVGLFSNRWAIGGVLAMIALQILFTYAPFMQTLFHSEPIDAAAWARIVAAGAITWGVVGVEKYLRRRSSRCAAEASSRA